MNIVIFTGPSIGYFRGRPLPRLTGKFGRGSYIRALGSCSGTVRVSVVSSSIRFGRSISLIGVSRTRYGFTTVFRKVVLPCSSASTHDSLSVLTNLYGPVYLPFWLLLPSCHTSTSELIVRSWISKVLGLFRILMALDTWR
jgi:hypothetical protein